MTDFKRKSDLCIINKSLSDRGWFFKENYLSDDLCDSISNTFIDNTDTNSFSKSKIGQRYASDENQSIRNSLFRWIDNWNDDPYLKELESELNQIMKSLRSYFRISLKRFESQFSIYNKGGFYICHLDQHSKSRHRQISCCLYLNDCIEGGELVLYKKGSTTIVDKVITPKKGSLAIFISADIYHEVKFVNTPRYSITTWFRDDELIPLI